MTIDEFQNITLIENVVSILQHGIVSSVEAAKLPHGSVALQGVQDKRDAKRVPGGLALHEYANVYFHARNPMMYRRQDEAPRLCVLRISTEILSIQGAVITDQNANTIYTVRLHKGPRKRQRRSILQPRVARRALPWVSRPKKRQP